MKPPARKRIGPEGDAGRKPPVQARGTSPRPAAGPSAPQRIAKLLARAGVASRRDIERYIADGRVALNGVVLVTPATLLASLAGVTVDGRPVADPEATRLWFFHKPAGCVTTAHDPQGRPTVFALLPRELPRVLSVGRLDFNTEGLLLLTNDGELKRWLELPANAVERRYRVRVRGTVTQAMLEALAEGVTVEGIRYGPIIADIEHKSGLTAWVAIQLTEGKNREIRRVMDYLGLGVSRLLRTGYGPFDLGELPRGAVVEAPPQWLARLDQPQARLSVDAAHHVRSEQAARRQPARKSTEPVIRAKPARKAPAPRRRPVRRDKPLV